MSYCNKTKNTVYKIEEKDNFLGYGGFGVAYKVLDKNNKRYALKFLSFFENGEPNEDKQKKIKEQYENEVEIMKTIKNKYAIKIEDNFYDENKGYCIVMELCDGNLRQILNKYKPNGLPLDIIKKYLLN